ncbi:MAG: hypothetical protein LBK83_15095 [Treponema sp.]|jgi:hypothetical protein|nr:hypothetical protein [Treponema sp.]
MKLHYGVLFSLTLGTALFSARHLKAETAASFSDPRPSLGFSCLWAGSWEEGGNLSNRADMRLRYDPPEPGSDAMLRLQFLDKRPTTGDKPGFSAPPLNPFGPGAKEGPSDFGAGLYHARSGSRLLYGTLDEWGLAARLRNPWLRALPFAENHKPSLADIKTEKTSTKPPETYLYLGSPALNPVRLFASLQGSFAEINEDGGMRPAFGGGAELKLPRSSELRFETFTASGRLPAQKASAWFSAEPSLPERDYRLSGFGLLFGSPYFSAASDLGYSETFSLGRDLYGSVALRFGKTGMSQTASPLPFSVSLAADAAGKRFAGRDGTAAGAGMRVGAKLEWPFRRNGLFRVSSSLRGPGLGEEFNRSETGLYWRLPAPPPRSKQALPGFRFSRLSLSAERDGRDIKKTLDGLDCSLAFVLHFPAGKGENRFLKSYLSSPLRLNYTFSLDGRPGLQDDVSPYPLSARGWEYAAAKWTAEFVWSPWILDLRSRFGQTAKDGKDAVWETSFSAACKTKFGRMGFKAASPDFPSKWNYTLSWRLELSSK